MIIKDIYKGIRLEINSLKARKLSVFFFIIAPVLVSGIFYLIARTPVDWGVYKHLGINSYDLFAPGIFPLIILFISIQLTILRIIGERSPHGTLDRDLLSISKTSLFLSKLIANFLIVLIQSSLIYLSMFYLFPVRNYGNIYIIFLIIVLTGLFGLTLGLFLSIISRSKEQAIELVPIILLILLIFSGIIIKTAYITPVMGFIATNSPLAIVSKSLEDIMLNGAGIEDVIINIYKFISWITLLILIGWLKFLFESK